MQRLSSNIAMNLVLWLLIINIISQAYGFPEKSSSRHQVCHITDEPTSASSILKIKYHYQGQVKLAVLKKILDSTLIGPFVPMWYIKRNGDLSAEYRIYNDPLLQPIFYHGVNDFSALTYFPSTRTLHGVIDQKFFIENLPLRNANSPEIVDTFIRPIPDELGHSINARYRCGMNNKRKSDEGPESSSSKKFRGNDEKKILYPEIFLVVDMPSTRIDTRPLNKYGRSIMYIISYWNAVDMLYRNLKRVDIRINIAGFLVMKRQNLEASGLVNSEDMQLNDTHLFMVRDKSLDSLGSYFFYRDIVKRDSYDFLIWMTSAVLTDIDVWNREYGDWYSSDKGASAPADCGGMHYDEIRNYKISNRAVVMYDDDYSQYHTAARELAHLMFVSNDDVEVWHDNHHSNCLSFDQISPSSGIMDPSNERVNGYLLWSYCSEIHFEDYSRSKFSCCLLNYPSRTMGWSQSLHPVTMITQCECYGMRAHSKMDNRHDICKRPLKCRDRRGRARQVGMPLDGTPCIPQGETYISFCNHNKCL